MSSSEDELEDNVFTQQRSLFKTGVDAFLVALQRFDDVLDAHWKSPATL